MREAAPSEGQSIEGYEIRGLVGLGGTSLVFAAIDLDLKRVLGKERKVALKFIWDLDRAQEEAKRLIHLDGQGSVNSLLAYFEAPFSQIADIVARGLTTRQDRTGEQLHFAPDHGFGILVLQFAHGQNIVHTEPAPSGLRLRKGEWPIEMNGQPFVQSLTLKLSLPEKIALIRGLIKVVKGAHDRTPPQIHGDLHPGNVVFDRISGDLVVIDWSGEGVYGAEGWISPWHDQLLLGEIKSLPVAADLYLLALWIERLLGSENKSWRHLAQVVLEGREASPRSIHEFSRMFEAATEGQARTKYRAAVYATAMIGLVLMVAVSWTIWHKRRISEKRDQVEDLVVQALQNPSRAEGVLSTLKEHLADPSYVTIKTDIIKGIGQIKLKNNNNLPFLKSLDLNQPNCVYISDEQRFVVFGQFAFTLGAAVSESEYIDEIHARGLQVRDSKSNAIREFKFPHHPLLHDDGKNQLIMYESDLSEVLACFAQMCDMNLMLLPKGKPTIFGLLRGENPNQLIEKILQRSGCEGSAYRRNTLEWVRCYDMPKGQTIQGGVANNMAFSLVNGLGYKLENIPDVFKQRSMNVVLEKEWDSFELFRALALSYGFEMIRNDQDHTIRFHPLQAE